MASALLNKFQTIIDWYATNNPEETRKLITPGDPEKINQLQKLIGYNLPTEFIDLYSYANGEDGPGMGIFLAHSFLSLDEIIAAVELSKTFVKPEKRTIDHPEQSE